MKKLSLVAFLLLATAASAWAQYPWVTVRQIQQVPAESLAVADTITNFSANSSQPRWTLQASPYMGDTVRVTALVAVPPGVITYTAGIWTMLLYDTAAVNSAWGGILLRANPPDSTQLKLDGFLNVAPGDIITLTGVISEFPTQRGFSTTQIAPVPGKPITIIGSMPVPPPIVKSIGDFYTGIFSSGKVQYATGEPLEGMIVEFRNVTVNNKVNVARGTFSVVDGSGNEISIYDWSHYFTLGHGAFLADTNWAKIYATLGNGRVVDTLRGVISTASGSEGPRGYRVAPLYPGDVKFSQVPPPPIVSSHRRNPVIVTPDTTATVSVKVTKQTDGSSPKTVSLTYSVGTTAYVTQAMTFQASDTTYVGVIPKQAANTQVRYFITMADSFGQAVRLANSATSGIAADTSKGVFFYTSLDRPLTIRDVQQTSYVNGRSPYLGAVTSLGGIITGDTAHVGLSPVTTGSTNAWFMENTGSQAWSGIWLTTSDTTAQKQMAALRNGDSVIVTGTVQEQFDVTRLGGITSVTKVSSGNTEPAAVVRTTGTLNVANGTASAEQYEGMVVRFANVTVTDVNPTFSDPTEFTVNDGSGGVVVQRSGKYNYSNVPSDSTLGKTILRVGNKIGFLTGIVYYSFNQYKFVPRTDGDFLNVVLTGVGDQPGSDVPAVYALSQNYPNPFNPSTLIQFALPVSGQTSLKVYNLLGQEVATLVNDVRAAGTHTVKFDAGHLSSGVYFFRVQSGSFAAVKRMMLLK